MDRMADKILTASSIAASCLSGGWSVSTALSYSDFISSAYRCGTPGILMEMTLLQDIPVVLIISGVAGLTASQRLTSRWSYWVRASSFMSSVAWLVAAGCVRFL